jgi:hypothetical protein
MDKNKEDVLKEKPTYVDENDLQEITEFVELKAFLKNDDIMGRHLVLFVNRGDIENAVGVNVHPIISKKLLNKLKEDNILK